MRAVVFANGILEKPDLAAALIQPGDFILSADGGLRHIRALGLLPDLLIGDLDSVQASDLDWLEKQRVEICKFPEDKDFTDLELALREAKKRGASEIMVVAALGGRVDQALANISLLSLMEFRDCDIYLDDGLTEIRVVRDKLTIRGKVGDIVSLLPLGRQAVGVLTSDLKYPLNTETLIPGQTRGVSNVMLADTAGVKLDQGALLCIHIRQNV